MKRIIEWIKLHGIKNIGYAILFILVFAFIPDSRLLWLKEFILGIIFGIFATHNFFLFKKIKL